MSQYVVVAVYKEDRVHVGTASSEFEAEYIASAWLRGDYDDPALLDRVVVISQAGIMSRYRDMIYAKRWKSAAALFPYSQVSSCLPDGDSSEYWAKVHAAH